MHPLPAADDGYVVDTPGLREVGLWGIRPQELDRCFPELRAYLGQCRFGDCRHRDEPDCAVRKGVERGVISTPRYQSYLKLYRELEQSSTDAD
jgi:ribosome biogenesis GTPase